MKNKIFLIVLIILCLGSGAATYYFFTQKEDIETKFKQAEKNFKSEKNKLSKELSLAKEKNRALIAEKEELQIEIKDLQTLRIKIKEINKELEWQRKEYEDLKKRYKNTVVKQESLAAQLKNSIGEKIVLKKTIKNLRSEPFLSKILEEKVALTLAKKEWAKERKNKKAEIEQLKKSLNSLKIETKKIAVIEKELVEKEKLVQALTKKMLNGEKEKFSLNQVLEKTEQKLKDSQKKNKKLFAKIGSIVKLFEQKLNKISKVKSATELSEEIKKAKDSLISELMGTEIPAVIVQTEKPKSQIKTTPEVKKTSASVAHAAIIPAVKTLKKKPEKLNGEILQINNKYNFVVINLGVKTGLKKHELLGVYRDKQKIGKIKIIELREQVSAADIVSFEKNIRRGDVVCRDSSGGRAKD